MRKIDYEHEVGEIVWGMKITKQTKMPNAKDKPSMRKAYEFTCVKCGYEGKITEVGLRRMRSDGCTCCKCQIIVEYINSIVANEETHWMVDYFPGGWNEAKLYAPQSNKTIEMKCPICKRIKTNKISNLYHRKNIGCTCGDGCSRLEKVFAEILKKNNLKFVKEYRLEGYKDKRYDFYIPSLNTIIETHGGQHFTVGKNSKWATLEEVQENDRLKYDRAVNRGFNYNDSYFIIECIDDRVEDIFNQVLSLPFIQLTKEEFDECLALSLNEGVKKIIEYLKEKPHASKNELCVKFNLDKERLNTLLRRCERQGIVKYKGKTYERLYTPGRTVYVFKEGKLYYEFESISLAVRELSILIDYPYKKEHLRKLCLSQGKYKEYDFSFNRCERLSE